MIQDQSTQHHPVVRQIERSSGCHLMAQVVESVRVLAQAWEEELDPGQERGLAEQLVMGSVVELDQGLVQLWVVEWVLVWVPVWVLAWVVELLMA